MPDASNLTPPKTPISSSKGAHSQPLSPGIAPPPSFIPPLFYETVRNINSPKSCPTPSRTGATPSTEVSERRDESTSPLMPMPAQSDPNDPDHPQEQAHTPAPTLGSFRPTHGPLYQRPFQHQPFPAQAYYSGHSAPPQEQQYPPPTPYSHRPGPGPGSGFVGQYMASQPSLPMALQSPPQFGYSHSFGHPGILAQETSSLPMPFNPPHVHGYAYPNPPAPNAEAHRSDRGSMTGQAYGGPSPPYLETAGATPQPGSGPSTPASHISHHGYTPAHYPQASTSPRYPGYPPHSFTHSSQALYPFVPATGTYAQSFYSQQPTSPDDASKGGRWWYMPHGSTQQYDPSAYQSGYPMPGYRPPMQIAPPDFDPYTPQAQPGPSSPPPFVALSNQPMRAPSGPTPARDRPPLPSSPVAARPTSDAPHADAASPLSKKLSPHDATSASPPAASRKSYHPNPPQNRSEWVMWVGNVPSDATHDELWRFFNQAAPAPAGAPASAVLSSRQVRGDDAPGDVWGGVTSVFLISRSNCAFVNFELEQQLLRAVAHFNGKPIRPRDPRCPRLVCRVRRKDDDLRAGVGGQRGMGLHARWVAEQKVRGREREQAQQKEREKGASESSGEGAEDTESSGDGPPTSPSTYLAPSSASDPSPPIPALSPMDSPGPVPIFGSHRFPGDRELRHGSSGNQSFTSTSSSFLASNFPKRYFILKSLTQYDLNLSVDRGIWATQPHNEGILDQAYRTSKDVFLIFGANKSGEFFGYARMAGPIFHNERVDSVSWASRSSGHGSVPGVRGSPEVIKEEDESANLLSPTEHRLVDESPLPVTPGEDARLRQFVSRQGSTGSKPDSDPATAPPELHEPHKPMSYRLSLRLPETLPPAQRRQRKTDVLPGAEGFHLCLQKPGDSAPQPQRDLSGRVLASHSVARSEKLANLEALRRLQGYDGPQAAIDARAELQTPPFVKPETTPEVQVENPQAEGKPEGWGREFKIEWLRTERLPFHRTRHLRNPWNHDREVKVSRDGTELEPGVGQRLLEEWAKPPAEVEASPPTSPASRGRGSRPPVRVAGSAASATTASISSPASQVHRSGTVGQGRGRGT